MKKPSKTSKGKAESATTHVIHVVETVISHRIRYAIRAKNAEDAKQAVLARRVEEFDQNYLGEQVFCTSKMSDAEFIESFEYPITDERKLRLVHVVAEVEEPKK